MSKLSNISWISRNTPANRIWTNICWSPELQLIVVTSHSTATDNIMTSPDGIIWTIRNAPNTNNLRAVAWSPKLGLFATVASTGVGNRVNTSVDGINWVAGVSAADYYFRDMIWVDELEMFIAVALTDAVTDKVMTSTDGINWELQQCPDKPWSDIVWAKELQLLCVSSTGSGGAPNQVMTSPDGINWTLRTTAIGGTQLSWEGLTWSGDLRLFVAVNYSIINGKVMTSPNGIDWTMRVVPGAKWLSAAWSPKLKEFVAVGDDSKLMRSKDGVNWILQTVPTNNWRRILWIDELEKFVAVAYYIGGVGGQLIMTSLEKTTPVRYLNTKINNGVGSISINETGISTKINLPPSPIADIYMIPSYGQSLSNNGGADASTFSSPVNIAYDQNLVNTNIQDMNGGYTEMFLNLLSEDRAGVPVNFKMMTCLGGGGGKSVLQLSNPSTFFTTLMNNIQAGKNKADVKGLTYNVPAFMWTQGEEDYRTDGVISNWGTGDWNPLEYASKLSTLIDQIDAGVKAITGQTNDVKCIMYQTGSHNFYKRYPVIAHQQLALAITDERVILAKTMYDIDYNTSDYVHVPSRTYRNMGNYYGIALYKTTVLNQRILPLHVTDHIISGNDIYLNCYVPYPPLVLDTTLVQPLPDGNYGFQLYDVANEDAGTSGTITVASVTITSVTLEDSNTIKITCSGSPVGKRLTYAINGDYWQNIAGTLTVSTGGEGPNGQAKSGRTYGARGNVRDSSPYENAVVSYLHLYNWMPIFEIEL